jgi:LuxR family transcriptional regulator, maltose regulon positive regulatory protein
MTGAPEIRLVARLDAAPDRRLTLVIVPSAHPDGTVTIRQWAMRQPVSVAWAPLTAADNHPPHFLETMIDAVRTVHPPVAAIDPSDGLETALTDLLNALLLVEQPFILILSHYQVIACPAIHDAMGWALDYLPPACRLIVISTSEPPIPNLARLRVRRQLLELRLPGS